ncbi:hypothetical protein S40288_00326 [Stachybotrys chartarum IBT 40288]|nr:hypothetical protein S40288_00326 [Stachybotrys chartarum IBT 40288]
MSSRSSNGGTPVRKGKKRVGWRAGDAGNGSGSGNGSGEGGATTATAADDVIGVVSDSTALTPLASPTPESSNSHSGAPDARELHIALTRILSDEREREQSADPDHQEPTQQRGRTRDVKDKSPTVGRLEPPLPKLPRPALRRNTSYDAPEEREQADLAEKQASEDKIRSITNARQRADRLAMSIHSYSAPGSRRNSSDFDPAFQPLMIDSDDHDATPGVSDNNANIPPRGGGSEHNHVRYRSARGKEAAQPQPQPEGDGNQIVAETLVQSHTTSRGKRDLFHHEPRSNVSGTTTPILQQAYVHDYVPRPDKYRGGILSSLLKLYQDDREKGSGYNTPSAPATPVMSPRPSPPTSRTSSAYGSPRSRPSSGLFNYHRSNNSTSSLALTELLKSSSMFAAPASGEIYDKWTEKIKKDNAPKSKKDQARITVHIAGILSRHRYLIKLCRALMMYGAPTHRLEEYMMMSSRVLEIEAQFLYMPSCMIISFDDRTTHTAEVKIVRVPQGVDLGRLRDVHNIYKEVVHDELGVEEATSRLDSVMSRKPKFPTWFCVFTYGVASVCVAPFAFQGRFIDLPVAFLLGCLVGILQLVFAPKNELYAHVFEVTAAIITSFLARGFGSIRGGQLFCFSALAQSSIALILPGYMVLCSSLELQSHNIVAGSVRMVHALIYTLFLGYGITIGASLYGMMDSNAASEVYCDAPLNRGWFFLFVPGFTMCLSIVNQAKWKQTPVMVVMATAGYAVNSFCGRYFEGNTQISNMLGALTIGLLANLYSRLGRHFDNAWLDVVEWWQFRVLPRFSKKKRKNSWPLPSMSDPESSPVPPDEKMQKAPRKVGYSLAAAAMLPAIFVQVPSGLAANGSLLAGITSANQITGNTTVTAGAANIGNLDTTAFNVLFSVVQVAIGISVGLFMSALIVYPMGKRRSGLFSF